MKIIKLIGASLILLSLLLIFHFMYNRVNETQYLNENNQAINEYLEDFGDNQQIDESINEIPPKTLKENSTIKPIGLLEIEEINLKAGFYDPSSWKNNVKYSIQVLERSTMPDKGGYLILAAHTGTSPVSYFRNLSKLEIGSIANIYYKNNIYKYTLEKTDIQPKTGRLNIELNPNYGLVLITCTKAYGDSQTIYYFSSVK